MKTKVIIAAAVILLGLELVTLNRAERGKRESTRPIVSVKKADEPMARPAFPGSKTVASHKALPADLVVQLLEGGGAPKLSPAQVEAYLDANHRSAASLLAAFQITGDRMLLQEAVGKAPGDPRVAFTAMFHAESPEEKRQWLEALGKSAPDNGLVNYLSAQDYLDNGRTNEAWQELQAAAGKAKFQDYAADFVQNTEEAYRATGYTDAEAKAMAEYSLAIPQFGELKGLGENLGALVNSFRAAGDEASAQAALQMGLSLSRQLGGTTGQSGLLQDLTAVAVESQMLGLMDPNAALGNSGVLAKDQLAELSRQSAAIKELAQQEEALLQGMSEQDVANFFERIKVGGEQSALRWALGRQGLAQ